MRTATPCTSPLSARLLALLGCVVTLALAAPVTHSQTRLETNSGRTYEGEIVFDDGISVEIEWGSASVKLPYAQLTPMSQYRLRRDKTADDADSQLDLADWCVDMTLYTEAKRHFRAAIEAEPLKSDEINQRLTAARTQAGKELLARAKSLAASNQPGEAHRILGIIVQELPLEPVASEAAHLLAEDVERRKQSTFVRKAAPSGKDTVPESERAKRRNGEAYSDETRALFADVIKSYQRMLERTQKGLVTSSQSSSIKEFEKAIKDGAKLRGQADKLRPMGVENPEIAEALELVDSKLEDALVDCRIHLADAYLLRSSYNQATEVVNHGLAEYPHNEQLRRAKDRVTSAAAYDSGGGWRIRGRRR
ncbi:MAG: hypothetical protein DRQ55_13455 [Planctomycetota bacterium]|nr:MAG: hypothetical protein DRQ55_13455 [Planctomycetota bacterium]